MKITPFRYTNLSLTSWGIFLGYLLLLTYFNIIDTYHHHFFSTGMTVVIYNISRLFFILYLIWLFFAAGDHILWHLAKSDYRICMTIESALLAFFSGVGAWHIVLLFVGLAGFYNRSLMATMTIIIFFLSLPKLDCLIRHIAAKKSHLYWPGLLLFCIPLGIFLITKGLYPAGGHDYFNHYFHYYRKVIETGSTLPNEVWYHFYYSKGAALYFLSMLLTDPLAPQLATTAMILAGSTIVFLILNAASSWRLLPWIGSSLYIAFLIYTPGPVINMHQGGWGDLEKPHEPAAVLTLALIWISIGLAKSSKLQSWGTTLLLAVSALVLISPAMAVFAIIYSSVIMTCFFIRRKKIATLWLLGGIATAGAWFVFLLIINYLLTGIPEDQDLFFFWPIINFDKVNQWGVLYELLIIHWMKTGLIGHQLPVNMSLLPKIMLYLRLDIWGPLCLLALTSFSVCLLKQTWRRSIFKELDRISLYAFGGFLLLTFLLSTYIGRDQTVSFYRFTTFTYAPVLCFCLLTLSPILRKWITGSIILTIGLSLAWFIMLPMINLKKDNIHSILKNSVRFTTGRYSIADAYRHQEGWPGRMPWGGIFPASEIVWKQLPYHTRIWSMHIHSYCMLPDCEMENYISYRFSSHAAIIYFGDPQEAKKWLKKENLNYFFFSRSLDLTDPLPLSPLFSPLHIADYLGIAWTDGDNTLLTWKEQARFPIDSAWLDRYNQRINESSNIKLFPYDSLRVALNAARKRSRLKQSDLPWSTSQSAI